MSERGPPKRGEEKVISMLEEERRRKSLRESESRRQKRRMSCAKKTWGSRLLLYFIMFNVMLVKVVDLLVCDVEFLVNFHCKETQFCHRLRDEERNSLEELLGLPIGGETIVGYERIRNRDGFGLTISMRLIFLSNN